MSRAPPLPPPELRASTRGPLKGPRATTAVRPHHWSTVMVGGATTPSHPEVSFVAEPTAQDPPGSSLPGSLVLSAGHRGLRQARGHPCAPVLPVDSAGDDVMMVVVVYSSVVYCLLLVFVVSYIGPHCPTALGLGFGWLRG
jgi:hypothetical protein